MDLSTAAAILTAVLVFYVGTRYCIKLFRKEISPRISTWLIFEIGVVMSLITYLTGSDHSITKAALNAADGVLVTAVLAALLIENGSRKIQFTRNELLSLVISAIATIVWVLTRTGLVGFIGFQLVMSIAYLPMIESLWHFKPGPSPEPMEKWAINVFISLLGALVDVTGHHDYVAIVYPLRALVLCAVIVVLIARWERKSKAALRALSPPTFPL